jgi:NAD(P)H-dependent FMN reductase
MARVLIIPGSARQGSLNTRLAHAAVKAVTKAGGEPTLVNLRELAMPLYDGDLEAANGLPAGARTLKAQFKAHDALLFCSPENNSSVSALMKNAIDWVSRQDGAESGLVPFQGKVALLTAASPGNLGGLRGLHHLRDSLEGLGVLVLPQTLAIPGADQAFDAEGQLEAGRQETLERLAARLVEVADRLAAGRAS